MVHLLLRLVAELSHPVFRILPLWRTSFTLLNYCIIQSVCLISGSSAPHLVFLILNPPDHVCLKMLGLEYQQLLSLLAPIF